MVKGLATVIYGVTDLEKAKAWYASAFQQAPYFDQPFYVGFNIGGYELGLDPNFTVGKPGAGGTVAVLGVSPKSNRPFSSSWRPVRRSLSPRRTSATGSRSPLWRILSATLSA